MPHTDLPGARIYYETSGDSTHQPVILIEGMGAQMIGWRDEFVAELTARRLFVVRMDNRDVGLSEKFGRPGEGSGNYTIGDMADDVCRVMDALGLASAHIVGQSMGGAIAQALAIERAERVRSTVLIYTAPAFDAEYLTAEVLEGSALSPPSASLSREEAISAFIEGQRISGSPAYPADEAWLRDLGGRSFDRAFHPQGITQQTAAMMNAKDRSAGLAAIRTPVAVIHGRDDRLVKAEAGIAIARLIRDAEFHLYPGMGHEVARPLWDDFARIIERTVSRG